MSPHAVKQSDDADLEFPHLPPFPDDVPVCPLLRLQLKKLLDRDEAELSRLWKASCELGFFYIDMRGVSSGEQLVDDAAALFTEGETLFRLPVEEKIKYDFGSKTNSHFGYKGYGAGLVDAKGTKDRNEFYNVSKDDILGVSEPLPAPDCLHACRPLMKSFMEASHGVVVLILDLLNEHLGLPAGTLANLHRLHAASGDQVRWVNAPPQPADDRRVAFGEHTDFGSVTLLFNQLGGLQVLLPDSKQWTWVKPLNGHAIVTIGDSLVKFTAGLLNSNIHRVVNPPGAQASWTRMSLIYFSRPEDDVVLKVQEGSPLIDEQTAQSPELLKEAPETAKAWILRRAMARRAGANFNKSIGTENGRCQEANE